MEGVWQIIYSSVSDPLIVFLYIVMLGVHILIIVFVCMCSLVSSSCGNAMKTLLNVLIHGWQCFFL